MDLLIKGCPCCGSGKVKVHTNYRTKNHDLRKILYCKNCDSYFSETSLTPMSGLRTPLSQVIEVLNARGEGLGLNATDQNHKVAKKTIIDWEWRLSALKPTLMLYSLMHQFISLVIEGDELYTKIGSNIPASKSEGWTIVLMERGSRFLWELACGPKDEKLFQGALEILSQVIDKTGEVTLLSDGERRYGNILFSICHEVIRGGKSGRPKKRLRKGVRVRLKNKGSKKGVGRPRKKYQVPVREHPETTHTVEENEIHANHAEAFNPSIRRRNSAYRRKTNTYAKTRNHLQRTLDVFWLTHNFIRVHFTTKVVPAVKLGLLETGLSWQQIFSIQYAP